MRNLTNLENEYTIGRNLSNSNGDIQTYTLSATLPIVYTENTDSASVISLKGLSGFTANKIIKVNSAGTALEYADDNNTEYTGTDPIDITGTTISLKGLTGFTANKVIKVNSAGNALEYADDNDTNFWNLNSNSLTPKLDSYNVIIGDEDNANANNVELLVYGDMELKQNLYSTNNAQNKIDFNTTYGIDFYGFYYSPSLRSYNVSFRNNTHGSYFPYLGVSNNGDFLFHINGRGDSMIMKADATRDILITHGDLIGETSSFYSKNRMKDIYCRNIYAEPIEIKNGTTSSGFVKLYENSSNGTGFAKLEAPASLASDITATLPSTSGTLALQSEIPDLNNVVSYSSTAASNISFGNATDLKNITMNTSGFLISSNTKNVDCVLTIKSDTDNNDESSNPVLRFNQDGDIVKAVIQLGDNDMYIQHQYTDDVATKLRLGAYNEEQLHLSHDQVRVNRANLSIQGVSSATPKIYFYDDNLSNYHILQGSTSLASNFTLTLPDVSGTLAITDNIPTTAEIRALFSSAGNPITYSNGVIGWTNSNNYITLTSLSASSPLIYDNTSGGFTTTFTPTSTETMENKTLKSPIFTSTSGAYEKMILKDENLTHNINIFTPDLTGNINIGFPSVTGTLAITDDIPNTTDIRALFSSAGNPITYSNGVIGWTNSNNYITNADVLTQIASAENVSTASILGNPNRTFGNAASTTIINGSSTTINGTALTLTNGDAVPKILFQEKSSAGTNKITLKPHTDSYADFEITLPSSQGQLALKTDIANLDNVVSYSSTAPSNIEFGNATTLREITMNTSEFMVTSGDKNQDCILTIKSDTDNNDESSNPILKFNQDGDAVKAVIQLGNNDMYIQHQYAGDATTKLRLGAYNEEQLHLYHDTADVFGTLNVLPTNTTNFYIQKLLASSISNGNYVEMILGKANSANNCATYAHYHSSDGSTSNFLQIGMKSKETMLQLKADTNIIMNSNKVDIITPNGTDNCNLILSAGHNGGAGNSAVIQLQNTNSGGTVKKAQLFLNGSDDYLVLKNLVTDSRIEMVVGTDVLGIFKGTQSEITTTTVIGSNRFKVKHASGFNFISNPEGTQFDDDTKAGSHITYHDNGTEMTFNCPNSTYRYTNSSNHRFMFNGGTRFGIFGSANPCIQMTKITGANFNKQGVGTVFPTEIGSWSSQTIPFLESFYIGGQSTNDSEGYFLTMNGQTTGISTPGDNEAFWWLDEDSAPGVVGWKISTAGAISTVSDSRTKSNVKTYKNSNFDKYKKIRTITYTRKIPKELNPKRLQKQSCIDKYNNIHYGVIAEELYDLYPEIENTQDIRKRDEWNYRKDNWNKGIYEKELDEWKEKKNNYDKEKGKDDKEEFKVKPPNKDFDEEMPFKVVDYERINIISVGVIQDLIKQNEIQQNQIEEQQKIIEQHEIIINKLLSSTSFKDFLS